MQGSIHEEAHRLAAEKVATTRAQAAALEAADLRGVLRKAIDARNEASKKAQKAHTAIDISRKMLAKVEADVAQYAGLAREITRHHADLIAEHALQGDGTLPTLSLSPELEKKQAEAEAAQRRLDEAKGEAAKIQAAQGLLANGVTAAGEEESRKQRAVIEAAKAIIAADAEEYLRGLLQEQRELWKKIDFAAGFVKFSQQPGGPPQTNQFVEMQHKILDRRWDESKANQANPVLIELHEWNRFLDRSYTAAATQWAAYSNRLITNADATLDERSGKQH